MLTIEETTFDSAWPLIDLMTKQHHQELSLVKDKLALDVDVEFYRLMFNNGRGVMFLLMDGNNVAGYAFFFVTPNSPRFKTKSLAANDVFYVAPKHRKGTDGIKIIKQLNTIMKSRYDIVTWHVKDSHDFSPVLLRDGFIKQDVCYSFVGD